jgi:replication-associated recombination protein RarA
MAMLNKMGALTLNGSKQLSSLLLFGAQGTGKSSMATFFAKNSNFTYVKIIAP